MFIKTLQAYIQALAEPGEELFKARTSKFYSRKSHIDYYQFYQKFEDHFKTLGATRMNRILFVALYLYDFLSFRWLSKSIAIKALLQLPSCIAKYFFEKTLEIFRFLSTISGVSFEEASNIN